MTSSPPPDFPEIDIDAFIADYEENNEDPLLGAPTSAAAPLDMDVDDFNWGSQPQPQHTAPPIAAAAADNRPTTIRPPPSDIDNDDLLPPLRKKGRSADATAAPPIDARVIVDRVTDVKARIAQRQAAARRGSTTTTEQSDCTVYRLPPLEFDCLAVSGVRNHRRAFLRRRKMSFGAGKCDQETDRLFERLDFDRLRRRIEAARKRSESAAAALDVESYSSTGTRLWVDRYKPSGYTELLSDEEINRSLLAWLRSWRVTPQNSSKASSRVIPPAQRKRYKFSKRAGNWRTIDAKPGSTDAYKIVLLSGPPGLGKTTLAHVIARHAGFDVFELNASDDRAVEQFRARLEDTMLNQSVHSDRPKCLVVDECDGLATPTVDYLIRTFIQPPTKKETAKKERLVLRRPVICICNDLYAPALRQLRKYALVLRCPMITKAKLTSRLDYICRSAGAQTDLSALSVLTERAEDDVRTCLNALQFLAARGRKISVDDIRRAPVGQKNRHRTLFNVWQAIFRYPKEVEFGLRHGTQRGAVDPTAARYRRLYEMIIGNGELEKILRGIFENYLALRGNEGDMRPVAATADWLAYADNLQSAIEQRQLWQLRAYQLYVPLSAHSHLVSSRWIETGALRYPTADADASRRADHSRETASAVLASLSPDVLAYCHGEYQQLAYETLPYVVDMLSLRLSTPNRDLFNARDRRLLADSAERLLSLGVRLRREVAAADPTAGGGRLTMEPDIEALARLHEQQRVGPTESLRALLATELDMERARRDESLMSADSASKGEVVRGSRVSMLQKALDDELFGRHRATTVATKVPMATKAKTRTMSLAHLTTSTRCEARIARFGYYRFTEGNPAPVFRNARWTDLVGLR